MALENCRLGEAGGDAKSGEAKVERMFGKFSKDGDPMKDRMKDKMKDKPGASRFPFAGRVALGIVGLLLAAHPALLGMGKPYLLRDINQTTLDYFGTGFFPFGGRLFFWHSSNFNPTEIWVTDGTPTGTLPCREYLRQPETWVPMLYPSILGDRMFLPADDGMNGSELWVTDGTPEGTTLLKDIRPGSEGSWPGIFGAFGDRLFFSADDGAHGWLWVTDGTPEGTVPWREQLGQPETWFASTSMPTALGGRLFFWTWDGIHGQEPWVTDGTPEGTTILKDINPGTAGSGPGGDMPFGDRLGDRLIFLANDGTHGLELWVTDGTSPGTALLKDINPGSESSEPDYYLTALGDRLFFQANDGTHGYELWVTDGTPEGTAPWREHLGQPETWRASMPTALGGRLFFWTWDGIHGQEPWVTDGTPEGTTILKDINPGTAGSGPGGDMPFGDRLGDRLFFQANDGLHGEELWITDGTPEGTAPWREHLGQPETWRPGMPTPLGNRLFFDADDGIHGTELWVTDGTPEGTSLVEDLRPGSEGARACVMTFLGCFPPGVFPYGNGTLFFTADDGVHGYELWALQVTPCPEEGDTHCLGLDVEGPEGGGPGTCVATATARDDSGDSISYTFRAERGDEAPIVIGPQVGSIASFDLEEGTWTVSVVVDDDPGCPDAAADAARSLTLKIPRGGFQRPGDANGDGKLDLSDAVWLLGHLFLGTQPKLPCEGGSASSPGEGDLALCDVNGDGRIDLSDPVRILGFLFLGSAPPALGTDCVRIAGCPDRCGE